MPVPTPAEEKEGLGRRLDKIERKIEGHHNRLKGDLGGIRVALRNTELSDVSLTMIKSGLDMLEKETANM